VVLAAEPRGAGEPGFVLPPRSGSSIAMELRPAPSPGLSSLIGVPRPVGSTIEVRRPPDIRARANVAVDRS
jgi:hypothetical protein